MLLICVQYQRSSTEGLCLGLFCMAVLGNTSYGLQIFLTSLYPTYLLESLPWLAGSLGVLGLDFIVSIHLLDQDIYPSSLI